jgi:hypothetical protein
MKLVGYARIYFGLPYLQTEGLLRTHGTTIPKVPDYTVIHKRINKLDIKVKPHLGDNITIAIDSTGIKVANRGEWMRDKWNKRRAYDSKNNSHLYYNDIIPGIKVRKNSSGLSRGCYPRKVSVISQLTNYQYWKDSVRYGKRCIVESVFSVPTRVFGEHVMAYKRQNMVKELELKIALYNQFVSAQERGN